MKRVYVAGPYNAPDVIGVLRNMRVGIKACVKLLQEYNVAPFCPWIDYQFSLQEEIPLEKYWEYSMAWLPAIGRHQPMRIALICRSAQTSAPRLGTPRG